MDADVIKPIIGGTQRVKDVLGAGRDFAIHGEVVEDGVDRLLVSHKCGIYLRLSVGYVICASSGSRASTHVSSTEPSLRSVRKPTSFLPIRTPVSLRSSFRA